MDKNIEINGFTFYKNYYELYKNLDKDSQRLLLIDTILKYMFEDKENDNLDGLVNAIWMNIKMPLATTKAAIKNGSKGGAPKGNKNSKKNKLKTSKQITKETSQKQANYISYFLFLISNFNILNKNIELKNKIEDWILYKYENNQEYKERGLKALFTQIENNVKIFGPEAVMNIIDESMANNYKGIIFEKLKKGKNNVKKDSILEQIDRVINEQN